MRIHNQSWFTTAVVLIYVIGIVLSISFLVSGPKEESLIYSCMLVGNIIGLLTNLEFRTYKD